MSLTQLYVCLFIIIVIIAVYYFFRTGDSVFQQYIYLDNNGTTELCREALSALTQATGFGNASAVYATQARSVINECDALIKSWLHAPDARVIHTSGGSESNCTILRSFASETPASNASGSIAEALLAGGIPHFVISSYEHSSLLDCANKLEASGVISLTKVPPDMFGIIRPELVMQSIRPETVLVSVMHINNETGNMNDIAMIARLVKANNPAIFVHSDIVQSFGKFSIPMQEWRLDAVSISFHKFNGPIGTGALVVSPAMFEKIKDSPLINGAQNSGTRGGTYNTPGIAGSLAALQVAIRDRDYKNEKLAGLRQYVIDQLRVYNTGDFRRYAGRPDSFFVSGPGDGTILSEYPSKAEIIIFGAGDSIPGSPATLLISVVKYCQDMRSHFCNVKLQSELLKRGVIVSIGSTCHSGNGKPGHVLLELKAPYIVRCGVIRISFSDTNTLSEIRRFCKILINCINLQIPS